MAGFTCPVDGQQLEAARESGQPVQRCPDCSGAWITEDHLGALEDEAIGDGVPKGQRRYGERAGQHSCPHCGQGMVEFRYAGYNLPVEACPAGAGYWLDEGEDSRIRQVMRERRSRLGQARSAEERFGHWRRGGGKGLLDRFKDLFRH